MNDQEYSHLKRKIHSLSGLSLDDYKPGQMRRRLDGFVERTQPVGVARYCQMLERDQDVLQKLLEFLTINVSEFFRDSGHFQVLESVMLPRLLQHTRRLNIWSAGCSIGAEPYSIAMILEDLSPGKTHRILATDLDQRVLDRAVAGGPYSASEIKLMKRGSRLRYFTEDHDGCRVVDKIRRKVEFKRRNLLDSNFEQGFDLILCRNVTIYFNDETKLRLNQRFAESLKEGGILFIGATETLSNAQDLGLKRLDNSLYVKSAAKPAADTTRETLTLARAA